MSRYWSETALFDWLRGKFGIEKPTALEWGAWSVWKRETKAAHPIGYWVTETLPRIIDKIDRNTVGHIDNARYYLRNRFWRQTHILPTGLSVGEYHDLDERILHGIMQGIVDYVEKELAWKSRWLSTEESKAVVWKNGRCAELGLKYLEWEKTLRMDESWGMEPTDANFGELTDQAQRAIDVLQLYNWWKTERPQRPDSHDASGWSQYCDDMDKKYGRDHFFESRDKETDEERARSRAALDKSHEIEAAYDAEDTAMLMKVIEIRKGLWT
jgi:hypothetical protein